MNFILVFLLVTELYSEKLCDCYFQEDLASAQKLNYEESDLIFLGKIVERNDDGSFKFEVLETLKGEEVGFVIGSLTNSCTIFPDENEEFWLVYTNSPNSDEFITMSQCGLSRSFKFPYLLKFTSPPPPRNPSDPTLHLESELEYSKKRIEALEILKSEIEQLRKWKELN
ncbi:hypothetical protein [Algoriphagus yeomjeoni]|uniref:Tissue inhibitor of metalloproteinase n=1 Tax=Algoriphagus yeomjeoni TaxID=291403 RepID=A0A327PRU6_9BACT|nr:hypothetical protein [Algoriphagus yeomjeoni]RAI94004.1 hypothetical protein LV83_00910 [Algoriphagus yeomjeoni]